MCFWNCADARREPPDWGDGGVLHEFDADGAADGGGGALDGVELDAVVLGIEQAIEVGAAGLHALGHGGLGDFLLLHFLLNLPGKDAFEGVSVGLGGETFFAQEGLKGGADVSIGVFHFSVSR